MEKKPTTVFLDANVVIQAGKPPGGPLFDRLVDLVKAGFIKVLTTELSKTEIAKKHIEDDYTVVKDVGRDHFRRLVEDVSDVKVPPINKSAIKAKLFTKHTEGVAKMFAALKAKTLSIDAIKPSVILDSYTQKKGLFSGEGKKDQFPDAFIFECIRAEASTNDPIVIISNDKDFDAPVKNEDNLSVLKSIEGLFKTLGLQVDDPDIEDFLDKQHDNLVDHFDSELKNWWLDASDVQDADIEVSTVEDVELGELTTFGTIEGGNEIIVIGNATLQANVSYTHPDWDTAIYDSEDGTSIPWNDDVSGETEVEVEVEFSMSIQANGQGEPTDIKELRFTSDEGLSVELHPPNEYK
jgi:hypothetical protein